MLALPYSTFVLYYFLLAISEPIFAMIPLKRMPECMRREFSQRNLKYGSLERKGGNNGKLNFRQEPVEVLHVFFRIHPRPVGGPTFDSFDVPSVSSYTLSRTLDLLGSDMRNRTTVSVLISSTDERFFSTLHDWTYALFKNRTLFTQIYKCPYGNMPSYECMMNQLFRHREDRLIENNDIIYFVEDDYMHKPEATKELVDIFSSHNPCFAVPYDYGDRRVHS